MLISAHFLENPALQQSNERNKACDECGNAYSPHAPLHSCNGTGASQWLDVSMQTLPETIFGQRNFQNTLRLFDTRCVCERLWPYRNECPCTGTNRGFHREGTDVAHQQDKSPSVPAEP